MTFKAVLFPVQVALHLRGGPSFSTDVVTFGSGDEARNRNWLYARGRWDAGYAAKSPRLWQQIIAFWYIIGGRAHSFLLKDWLDYTATASEGVFIDIDGSTKQLAKRWTFGAFTYDHPIYKPKTGTVTITGGGTLDYDTGIVTGGTPTSWSGEFYKPARFDIDALPMEIADRSLAKGFITTVDSIPIIELHLEDDEEAES